MKHKNKDLRPNCKWCIYKWHGATKCTSGPLLPEDWKKATKGKGFTNNPSITRWVQRNTDKHLCKCGCGRYIKIRREYHMKSLGIPSYLQGHGRRKVKKL